VVVPELRSSVLERLGARDGPDLVLTRRRARDLDPGLLLGWSGRIIEGSWWQLMLAARRAHPTLLEVPEPHWYRAWPGTLLVLLGVRLRPARADRPRAFVATVAIENLPTAEGLSVRRLGVPGSVASKLDPVLLAVWSRSVALLDGVVFGTDAARRNWEESLSGPLRGLLTTTIAESLPPCVPCGAGAGAGAGAGGQQGGADVRGDSVLYLAEFSARKGLPAMLAAWPLVAAARPGLRLTLMGFGALLAEAEAAADRADVQVAVAPLRPQVHAALARASVVVLPSQRVPGWREQVGLPLLEGLAHDCAVVTTTESGLAGALLAAGQQVVAPGQPHTLAAAIVRAADQPRRRLHPPDSREAVHRWLRAATSSG